MCTFEVCVCGRGGRGEANKGVMKEKARWGTCMPNVKEMRKWTKKQEPREEKE